MIAKHPLYSAEPFILPTQTLHKLWYYVRVNWRAFTPREILPKVAPCGLRHFWSSFTIPEIIEVTSGRKLFTDVGEVLELQDKIDRKELDLMLIAIVDRGADFHTLVTPYAVHIWSVETLLELDGRIGVVLTSGIPRRLALGLEYLEPKSFYLGRVERSVLSMMPQSAKQLKKVQK